MKLTVLPAVETVPDHTGGAQGTVKVTLAFSGLSHTDQVLQDLTKFEGVVKAGNFVSDVEAALHFKNLLSAVEKL